MLKRVRIIYQTAISLTTLLALLTVFLQPDQQRTALGVVLGLMAVCIVFLVRKWKCPYCGRMLPTNSMRKLKVCPYCEKPLDN